MANFKLVCAVVLCMLVVASEAAINCNTVNSKLAPCLSYLRNGGAVTTACCNGVKALNSAARTTPDRQAACECMKTAAKAVKVNEGNAGSLPGKCGVSIPYKISINTNCKSVK